MKYGHITYINPSFHFKKFTLKLLTVGCVLGLFGCGTKQKEYSNAKEQEQITVEVENDSKQNINENQEIEFISLGESSNELKLLILNNSDLTPLHFGYFRREKEVTEDHKTIYKAYFDDVMSGEEIDLGALEQKNESTCFYYQLASRFLNSNDMIRGLVPKTTLQAFITDHQNDLVVRKEYYESFADRDVYQIKASDISHDFIAGSIHSNEVAENRKSK